MDYEDYEDFELDGEDAGWDEEALELEWDESEAQSVIRSLGVTSALSA